MIGNGIPNPLLFSGGDPLDELGKIERSIRFRAAAGAVMSRAVTVTGDRKKWKMVIDVKGAGLGTSYCLFDAYLDIQNFTRVYLMSTGAIQFDTSTGNVIVGQAITSSLKRDPVAHFELGITFDSANATAADRMIIEINGVRQSLSAYSAPALNLDSWMNMSGTTLYFGRTGSAALYFDGYLSWPRLTDGQVPAASAYGVSHPRTSQWRPKGKSAIRAAVAAGGGARNGWGTNGFFLPLDDVTSLTTLCYDRSQSDTDTTGNNFTATNISLTSGTTFDSMLDTPTTNYCTWNPIFPGDSTKTNGNLDAAGTARGTHDAGAFACQWEITANAASVVGGVVSEAGSANTIAIPNGSTYGFRLSGGALEYTTNGSSWTSIATVLSGMRFPYASGGANTINCGQRAMAYALSSGFRSLCTKNLPFPKIPKSSAAFVAVTDTGANIAATLAAARAGFGSYIDIIKRRDTTAEGWRWIFSDDPTNYLDSSSTGVKAAVPAFGGTSYVGYSLRVSAANGVATGRLVHTNGVTDNIADGLANARKMVILKNEATGVWYVFHPDLTAGKLLYLEQKTIETTDSTINSVTASGFTVAAALASGTYRWVSIAELEGAIRLWKYTGNAVTNDGPFLNLGMSELIDICRRIDAPAPWSLHDSVRSQNANVLELQLNATQGENGLTDSDPANIDLVSNGKKIRTNVSDTNAGYSNASGGVYVGISFAAFPFRYANAR